MAHGAGAAVAPPRTAAAPRAPQRSFVRALTDNWGSVVAILIGLVTLTGALVTWKSVNLSGNAGDADRKAVLDTISQQKSLAAAEAELSFEQVNFGRLRAEMAAAEHVEAMAADAHKTNQPDADELDHEARVYRAQVQVLTDSQVVNPSYVTGTTSDDLKFDSDRRLKDLQKASPYSEPSVADPAVTARQADRLHDRALRLILFVVGFALVVVMLTVSQVVKRVRLPLASAGFVIFVVLTAVALLGDHR